jgi:hypothetical protein
MNRKVTNGDSLRGGWFWRIKAGVIEYLERIEND